ncbi:hypothetical protein [Sphingomonas sp.]|uniref:hypothetical protein n=1 Tax=Sphingomonas sp. TaxID=28214 RepID=UPI003D6C7242
MKFALRLCIISLLPLGAPAFADITANYMAPNNAMSMKIEVASNSDVRAATTNPNSYFITREGHDYVVQASFNGPAVMRVEDMASVMAEQMKKMMPNMPEDKGKDALEFQLVKGGVVTIRGRQGIAYYGGMQKSGAPLGEPVVVISTDPELAPLGAAMSHQFDMSIAMMGQILGNKNPFKGMQDILKTGAPLVFTRMGDCQEFCA